MTSRKMAFTDDVFTNSDSTSTRPNHSICQIVPQELKTGIRTQTLLVTSVMVFGGAIFIGIFVVNTVWPCEFNFCSGGPVKTVTIASAYLYAGNLATSTSNATASFALSLNNPGSLTFVTLLTLSRHGVITTGSTFCNGTSIETATNGTVVGYATSDGVDLTVTEWDNNSLPSSPTNSVDFSSAHSGNNVLAPGKVTSLTFYLVGSSPQRISAGQLFDYIINFQNGQSVSGSLIAE